MEVYKFKADAFKEIRKKILLRTIPLLLIALAIGFGMGFMNGDSSIDDPLTLAIVIPGILLVAGFAVYRSISVQKAYLETYTLTIADNVITREQFNTPTITLHFFELKDIVKKKNGLIIIGEKDIIIVPKLVDNFEQLESTLGTIQPIGTKDTTPFFYKFQPHIGIVSFGLLYCVYTMSNKIVVSITGSLLIVLIIWSFIESQRSKNVDYTTKKTRLIRLFILGIVISSMLDKLAGISIFRMLT